MKVIKRSGEEVLFDANKIKKAVQKANEATEVHHQADEEVIQQISEGVVAKCKALSRSVSVEEIQDMVENALMEAKVYQVAHNYITYRYERALVRKANTTDKKILSLLERNNEEAKQEESNSKQYPT